MEAYWVALSGLALNEQHVKLSHVLSQCHSKLTLKDITKNIVDEPKNPMLHKVHYVNLYGYSFNAKMGYLTTLCNQKEAELKQMDEEDRKREMDKILKSAREHPFFQRHHSIQREGAEQGIH